MIPRLADALFAVLDRADRAVTDARHAVGASFAPNRLAVFQRDVVHRTALRALPAADAGVRYGKGVRFDEKSVENRVDRAAHKAVIEIVPRRRERLIALNRRNRSVDAGFGLGDDFPRFVRLRRGKHRNVVLRHDDLRRAHAGNRLFRAEVAIILVGIADLAAAGHDEPRLLRAAQLRFPKPVAHDARNAPGIGRRDDDNPLAGFNGRSVGSLDAVVQIHKRIAQRVRNALGDVFAVSGARKVKNHIKIPSQWSISC